MHQKTAKRGEGIVLRRSIVNEIGPFELDPDRKIVAITPSLPRGRAGMPRPSRQGHELHQITLSPDQKMRRYPQIRDGGKGFVFRRIQTVAKKGLDPRSAEFSRRQADAMHHDQIGSAVGWAQVEIRRWCIPRPRHPLSLLVQTQRHSLYPDSAKVLTISLLERDSQEAAFPSNPRR